MMGEIIVAQQIRPIQI